MQKVRILIVEDDFKLSLAISLRLKNLGYETLQAHDGVEAVSMAEEARPDLILMDISLPVNDGFDVARAVQSLRELTLTPIIFITASKKDGLRETAEELGAADFIEKPFEENQLKESIENALEEFQQLELVRSGP